MKAIDNERTYTDHNDEQSVSHNLSIYEYDGTPLKEDSKKSLIQAILGAVDMGRVSESEGIRLTTEIVGNPYRDTSRFSNNDREIFLSVSANDMLESFARKRRVQVFSEAVMARASVSLVYDEMGVKVPSIDWYDKFGVASDNDNGVIVPRVIRFDDNLAEIIDMSGADSPEYKIAEQNPDYVNGFRFVIDASKPKHDYLQLINVYEDESVTPFATILSDNYFDEDEIDGVESDEPRPIAEN